MSNKTVTLPEITTKDLPANIDERAVTNKLNKDYC